MDPLRGDCDQSPILKRILTSGPIPPPYNCILVQLIAFKFNVKLIFVFPIDFPFTAVRFGRVPKREKAKILAAMQSVNARLAERNLPAEFSDEMQLMQSVVRAHMETCDFTREKVQLLMEEAHRQPNYTACPPTLVSVFPFNSASSHSSPTRNLHTRTRSRKEGRKEGRERIGWYCVSKMALMNFPLRRKRPNRMAVQGESLCCPFHFVDNQTTIKEQQQQSCVTSTLVRSGSTFGSCAKLMRKRKNTKWWRTNERTKWTDLILQMLLWHWTHTGHWQRSSGGTEAASRSTFQQKHHDDVQCSCAVRLPPDKQRERTKYNWIKKKI